MYISSLFNIAQAPSSLRSDMYITFVYLLCQVSCNTRHNIRLLADIIYSVAFSVKPPGTFTHTHILYTITLHMHSYTNTHLFRPNFLMK